jgi:hypothetical protein
VTVVPQFLRSVWLSVLRGRFDVGIAAREEEVFVGIILPLDEVRRRSIFAPDLNDEAPFRDRPNPMTTDHYFVSGDCTHFDDLQT